MSVQVWLTLQYWHLVEWFKTSDFGSDIEFTSITGSNPVVPTRQDSSVGSILVTPSRKKMAES